MNEMKIMAVHKCFIINHIEKFQNRIDNNIITVETRNDEIIIYIRSRKGRDKLCSFGFQIMEILFIYIGAFPEFKSVIINGVEQDTTQYANKFSTYSYYVRNDLLMCKINAESLNETVFQRFKMINHMPLSSMEYIFSQPYKKVNIAHKVTLLTHVIEGITPDKYYKERVGDVFEEFFRYHRKYGCEIMHLLNKNRKSFIEVFVDTRHWYSHFLRESERIGRMKSGTEMVIYFDILYYCIRFYLIKKLEVTVCGDKIKEYLYAVHDWILEIKYGKNGPFKSGVYQANMKWQEIQQEMEELAQRATEEIELI